MDNDNPAKKCLQNAFHVHTRISCTPSPLVTARGVFRSVWDRTGSGTCDHEGLRQKVERH